MELVKISDAVLRLRKKNISITRQRVYQLCYEGRLSYVQRQDELGKGQARPGGRLLVDWDELESMFVLHPKERD